MKNKLLFVLYILFTILVGYSALDYLSKFQFDIHVMRTQGIGLNYLLTLYLIALVDFAIAASVFYIAAFNKRRKIKKYLFWPLLPLILPGLAWVLIGYSLMADCFGYRCWNWISFSYVFVLYIAGPVAVILPPLISSYRLMRSK